MANSCSAYKEWSTGEISGCSQFSIAQAQLIRWTATWKGSAGDGNDFCLSEVGGLACQYTLSSNLPGFDSGEYNLQAGNYEINIDSFRMGPGTYTIEYNLVTRIEMSPSSHNFSAGGPLLQNSPEPSPVSFTISNTGDWDVTVDSVVSTDNVNFEIVGAPTNTQLPPSRTFQVRCKTDNVGPHSATITVTCRNDHGDITTETATVSSNIRAPTASIGVSPSTHNFGDILEDDTDTHSFTITSTGDLPVTIGSITSLDNIHFKIVPPPANTQVPPNTTFQIRCEAGQIAGHYPAAVAAVITVNGTSAAGNVSAQITVSCRVIPKEPNIVCIGPTDLGTADWFIEEVKTITKGFQNTGTDTLQVNSIDIVNDTAPGVFSPDGAPPLAALPADGIRDVQIRFAPPLSGGEAVYYGHLSIQSNDPDEPVKDCPFHATAHHPVPVMVIESEILEFREVELGFTYTKVLKVGNLGDATLQVTISVADLNDPDLIHFILSEGSATVAPGAAAAVFLQSYSPQAVGGPHSIQLDVTGNDPAYPSASILLLGEGLHPVPIDGALVLDRSGSMAQSAGARRKIDALQKAANLFVDLLRPEIPDSGTGDKVGLVRYDHENDVYLGLDFVDSSHIADAHDRLSDAAIDDINRLAPRGTTWIGGAMITGADMLVDSPTDRKHIMVLLTDGKENVYNPGIDGAIGPITSDDPELVIYSVGLGESVNAERLQRIATVTNGDYRAVNDLSGLSIFDLEAFYFKIFCNATGMDLVNDPTHPVSLGGDSPVIVDSARIVSSDRRALFLVLHTPEWEYLYDLELVDPSGQVISLNSAIAGIPIHRIKRYNYTVYRLIFPSADQMAPYLGDWILRLTPRTVGNPQPMALARKVNVGLVKPGDMTIPIGFAAAVKSDYKLSVQTIPSSYEPGAEIRLTATLSDRGMPAPNGSVEVQVRTPSGGDHLVQLFDEGTHGDETPGDATWTNRFIQTNESGIYRFVFRSMGTNDRGESVPRMDTRIVHLQPKTPDPQEAACIPCWLQRLLWLIVIVLLILILMIVAPGLFVTP